MAVARSAQWGLWDSSGGAGSHFTMDCIPFPSLPAAPCLRSMNFRELSRSSSSKKIGTSELNGKEGGMVPKKNTVEPGNEGSMETLLSRLL